MSGRYVALSAAVLGMSVPARALAQGEAPPAPALELHWTGPPECPDPSSLTSEVSRLTLAAREPRIDADANAWKDEKSRWHIALVTRLGDERGERIVEAETCALAMDAAALVLALVIDPSGVRARLDPPHDPSEGPSPGGDPTKPNEAPPPPVLAEERVALAAYGAFDAGSLPNTGYGFGGLASLRVAPWAQRPSALRVRVEGAFTIYPSQRGATTADSSRGADLHLTTGSLRGALGFGERIEGSVFAGIELGSMGGGAFGVRAPESGATLWTAAIIGGSVRLPARGLVGLRVAGEIAMPFRRTEFVVNDEAVHRANSVVPRGSLGAEVRF